MRHILNVLIDWVCYLWPTMRYVFLGLLLLFACVLWGVGCGMRCY